MRSFMVSFVLPLLLLGASLHNWSLISFINMLAFLTIQALAPERISHLPRHSMVLWCIVVFSLIAILGHSVFHIIWLMKGVGWSEMALWWAKLIGFTSEQPWGSSSLVYFIIMQSAVTLVCIGEIYGIFIQTQGSFWRTISSSVDVLGPRLKVSCCILLPPLQLAVGISHPSWLSFPFFVCSCVGLVHWSLSSNFLGLFWCWRPLLMYASFNILILYGYQLPIDFPEMINVIVHFIGLMKILKTTEMMENSSAVFLVMFFFLLSSVRTDLEETEDIISGQGGSATEPLLPSNHTLPLSEFRSGMVCTNVLLMRTIFRFFNINFFTYGFPVLLIALAFWSFNFASICAFGLLAYVGYILYAFPSLFDLHQLNGLLLIFILLWAACTYVFNVAFSFLNTKLSKDMEIWETIGFWHYSIPGFFLLAQFCLGALVAVGNLVNNSVFLCISNGDQQSLNVENSSEEEENVKVLIIATFAWGLRKVSRAITLGLIFLLALKPGFIHAVYGIFLMVYLLSHSISINIRKLMVIYCEIHFTLLYILRLNLISSMMDRCGPMIQMIFSQSGLKNRWIMVEYMEIAILVCFCAVQNHGSKMLFSFSTIVQQTPCRPFGFSILKEGLDKSLLLSVYSSPESRDVQSVDSRRVKWIATYLSEVGGKFLSAYRSFGTYVAFLTILSTVYIVIPNYISFGYVFFLLFWILGRQLVEKTKRRLWFPLKLYATCVFVFTYSLSISTSFQALMSKVLNLYNDLGFNPSASLFGNVWQSLAVLVVMQLYSYERRQRRRITETRDVPSEPGVLDFLKRLLIWHSDKLLSIAVFYASLTRISAFGFLYLLGLVACSTLPKISRIPSKLFLVYTGIILMLEYLFQIWGKEDGMLPGDDFSGLYQFFGFRLFEPGFWGFESGLRGKVLVIVACTLQYNTFHWLNTMTSPEPNLGKWDEPCVLFIHQDFPEIRNLSYVSEGIHPTENSSQFISEENSNQESASTEISPTRRPELGNSYWGSFKESHKWSKRLILALSKERLESQKSSLKIYFRFWMENIFNLLGLELNMIALLLASFALLNVFSVYYVISLAACILLKREVIRKLWPLFFFFSASILVVEYFAMWKDIIPWTQTSSETNIHCHDCWDVSEQHFDYCKKCWLGIVVDDTRMLASYYIVFIMSSFKLRSDNSVSVVTTQKYIQMMSHFKSSTIWRDLSFETKSMWTIIDYLRVHAYCHLLDGVLILILITGTLEYDILHFGYLFFALFFFTKRLQILKRKNKVFRYLRIYNFLVIVLSLACQSPYIGNGMRERRMAGCAFEVIGFRKYDYGFRITSRSALVEIIIFFLVSFQSYIFCSREYFYVSRYLEAEQIGSIVREQEKRASWKTAQLRHIRKAQEVKRQRNLQVEKMKAEMLNLQINLQRMNSAPEFIGSSSERNGLRRRRRTSSAQDGDNKKSPELLSSLGPKMLEIRMNDEKIQKKPIDFLGEITEETEGDTRAKPDSENTTEKVKAKDNPLISAVHFIEDGVCQVQSLGNQAVTNIVSFLNIEQDDSESSGHCPDNDAIYDEVESQICLGAITTEYKSSIDSEIGRSPNASLQIGKIFHFLWSQIRANNEIVCYCCFVFVFLWNFGVLSMVYLAALFLYALCVNSGPSYFFWFIMLVYTEVYILLQYCYQIAIQHCELKINLVVLRRLGFSEQKTTNSFVMNNFPLFLVYMFTLLQSLITPRNGEWNFISESRFSRGRLTNDGVSTILCLKDRVWLFFVPIVNGTKILVRNLCRYWLSLIQGSETPPYFVQISMDIEKWPEDGIQPETIESSINEILDVIYEENHDEKRCKSDRGASRVRIQSIERSTEHENIALAVFEVIHASVGSHFERSWTLTPASDVAAEILKAKNLGIFEERGFPYHVVSVIGGGKREIDLYAYIFGADLAVFFLVAMFYQSIIKNNSKFLEVYQLEDQFPKEFVFILMALFFLIVLDRIIYLCSFATAKVIFYIFNIVLFTYSVTEYAWYLKLPRQHLGGLALRAIYLAKALSLALQAVQIQHGIPHKSTLYRQFLTSQVTQINYLGFRLYRALPFLYELRCVLDWSCTLTSLTMYDWLKLEDITASLYLVKCDTDLNRAGHQPGQKQTMMTKFCSGICLFFILICVIWAPMLIYSSGNPTNIENPILDARVQIDVKTDAGRLALYHTSMCQRVDYANIQANLDPDNLLNSYNVRDIQLICCQEDASSTWTVPAVVQNRFIGSIDFKMQLVFSWFLTRDRPKGKETVKYEVSCGSLCVNSSSVKDVLNGANVSFTIEDIYSRFFQVTGSGEVRLLKLSRISVDGEISLKKGSPPWWSFRDVHAPDVEECTGLTGPMAIVISEETPPQGILGETLSKFNIWSLYLTFVLAVGRFIRLQCSDLRMRIPFENLPSCDRLVAICEDIYAARAEGALDVEEVLYWTLVKIYRSPHMLLEYTKPD
ncbi:piezo-type mechanosensitive ion channel component [Wolffia australiana]